MTHIWIIAMYTLPILAFWGLSEVSWYVFVQCFGILDNYLQNCHWKSLEKTRAIQQERRLAA